MRIFCLMYFAFYVSLSGVSQCINTFPYNQDFETGNGNWVSGGTGDDWAWGAVSKTVIAQAASGSNCWVTGGLIASFYNYGERSFVQSPCFDFSSLQYPVVSFNIYWETERTYDGAVFQYSLDGGLNWQNAGSSSDITDCLNQNWFNTSSINNLNGLTTNREGWAGNVQSTNGSCQGGNGSNGWKHAQHCVPYLAGEPNVIFRFAFGAGTQCNNFDGFAFDDFELDEAPTPVVNFTYSCSGSTISFIGTSSQCPTNFNWDFGDGSTGTGISTSHTYQTSTNHTVTFSVSGSCYSTTSVTHQVQMLNATAIALNVSCNGANDGSAIATVTGGSTYSYVWNTSPPQNTNTATNLAAGNYTVTISAPNFCDVIAAVTVTEPTPISNNFLITADTCLAGVGEISSTVSGGTPPYNFAWSNGGGNTNLLTQLAVGNYSLTITDANNCTLLTDADIPFATDIVIQKAQLGNVSCLETGNGSIAVIVTGGLAPYNYLWSNSANTSAISNLTEGKYLLTVTDANNCSAADSSIIEKEICPSYIYFPTAFSPNGDGANETFRPKYSIDLKEYFIRIYNRWGEEVYESTDVNEGWNGTYKNIAQPLSVYVWYAEYSFLDGKKHTEGGNVTLVK